MSDTITIEQVLTEYQRLHAEHKRVLAERDALLKAVEASEREYHHFSWRYCQARNTDATDLCAHHLRLAALKLVNDGATS